MDLNNLTKEEKFETFKAKAEAVGANVTKAANANQAIEVIAGIIKDNGYKTAVSTELSMVSLEEVVNAVKGAGCTIETGRPKVATIEKTEVGITEFDTGIIELGTIAQDATDPYARLMSMLPPYHIALIKGDSFVADFGQALDKLYEANGNQMPGFVAYVTGPSRTSDIERVLTIGVHGPKRLYIIVID